MNIVSDKTPEQGGGVSAKPSPLIKANIGKIPHKVYINSVKKGSKRGR